MSYSPHNVEQYFADGCGRCPLGGTPQCSVRTWHAALLQLRTIVLDCLLTEELKWAHPCYTYQQKNVVMLGAFKSYCTLSFMKGILLHDAHGILTKPGENTHAARIIRFDDASQVSALAPLITAYIYEAIAIEKAGLPLPPPQQLSSITPHEWQQQILLHPPLEAAFAALTAGRQRAYMLHFAAPKQAKTRTARIEKCIPYILAGRGLHE